MVCRGQMHILDVVTGHFCTACIIYNCNYVLCLSLLDMSTTHMEYKDEKSCDTKIV